MYGAEYFIMQGANGLIMGCLYGMMAVGLALIFSVLKVINFAHGEFYMVGGYMAYFLLTMFGGLHPVWGVLFAMAVLLVIGSGFDYLFLRPMHKGLVNRRPFDRRWSGNCIDDGYDVLHQTDLDRKSNTSGQPRQGCRIYRRG